VSSFSGSTEETLEALDALPRDARNVVVVTGGGPLLALATERHYPVIRIPVEREPPGFQPRSAVGYFLTYFSRLLAAAGLMIDPTPHLAAAATFLHTLSFHDDAEEFARWLGGRIPVVYTDEDYMLAVARIAKIKFNENSKRPAFFNALPEANHNEMIGFVKNLAKFAIIYIHDERSHPRVSRRFEVMRTVFHEDGLEHVDFYRWTMPGTNRLEKILATLAFVEQCSYYVALLDGFDPTPVDLVQEFKRVMSR
jgi:glucose/mannose-6-phosphate isomerase